MNEPQRYIADEVSVGEKLTVTLPSGEVVQVVVLGEYPGGSIRIDYATARERVEQ